MSDCPKCGETLRADGSCNWDHKQYTEPPDISYLGMVDGACYCMYCGAGLTPEGLVIPLTDGAEIARLRAALLDVATIIETPNGYEEHCDLLDRMDSAAEKARKAAGESP